VRTELLVDRIGDDAVLNREVVGADGINAIPLAKLHRGMVENHVVGLATAGTDVDAAGTAAAATLSDTQMAADDVVLCKRRLKSAAGSCV